MNFPKAAVELYRFASKDAMRVNINVVRVEWDAKATTAIAVATDGHRLCYFEFDMGTSFDEAGAAHLSSAILKNLKLKRGDVARLGPHGSLSITRADGTTLSVPATRDIDSFPTWRKALPEIVESEKACSKVAVNVTYIADFATYLKAVGIAEKIYIEPGKSAADAIRITAHGPISDTDVESTAITYIVMPMRL